MEYRPEHCDLFEHLSGWHKRAAIYCADCGRSLDNGSVRVTPRGVVCMPPCLSPELRTVLGVDVPPGARCR